MIIQKEFNENIHLHILYFTLETFYQTAYPSYPNDIKKQIQKSLSVLKNYIDHGYGDYDPIEQTFYSKIKFEKK